MSPSRAWASSTATGRDVDARRSSAQIAGRAGRGMRDGTFGTTAQCPPLPEDVIARVESHSFDPLEQLCWRNADLDFSHVDRLLATLTAPPPGPGLVRGNDASDLETLASLAREPEIRTWRKDDGGSDCSGRLARSRISASSPTTRTPGSALEFLGTSLARQASA